VTREEVQRRLSEQRAELAELSVRSLEIFGSIARGEAAPESDVDLLVEFDRAIGACSTSPGCSAVWSRSSAARSTWSCATP
jgi:predicted nucleotidyltransferase